MILDLIFPVQCVSCGRAGDYVCPQCRKQLSPHAEVCPITHFPSVEYKVRTDKCSSPLDGGIVLFRFDPVITKLIRALKYYHRAHTAGFLGQRLALAVQTHSVLSQALEQGTLIISYVPSHRIRHYITKGYNQSELLARALAASLEYPACQKLCIKTKHTPSQVGLDKIQRKKNVSDAFRVVAPIPAGATIVIVDDVLTSGTTLESLASTIKTHQPDCEVWGLCLARNA